MAQMLASQKGLSCASTQRSTSRSTPSVVCSLRPVRPFVAITSKGASISRVSQAQLVVVRSAEVMEAPVTDDETDFVFSLSDAKKDNTYTPEDVEAAMNYFVDGVGSAPMYEEDHISNFFGVEDASYFDDIDNNEAYEADEYCVAGIPEAAPKQKGRGGRRQEAGKPGGEDEEDDFSKAREQGVVKAMEDRMVMAAQMEEMGLDKKPAASLSTKAAGPAVWDWMQDFEDTDSDSANARLSSLVSTPYRAVSSVADNLPSDEMLFSDVRASTLEELDVNARDLLEFLVDDYDLDADLKMVADVDADLTSNTLELPEMEAVSQDLMNEIEALLKEDLSLPEMDEDFMNERVMVDDEEETETLDPAQVQAYLDSVAAVQGAELTQEQTEMLFAPDAVQPSSVDAAECADDAESSNDAALLSGAPVSASADERLTNEEASLENLIDEVDDDEEDADLANFRSELESLSEAAAADLEYPSDELMEVVQQYLTLGQDYVTGEEDRKAEIAEAVAAGTMEASALDEVAEEDMVDVESELLDMGDDDDDALDEPPAEEEDDGIQWTERIIQLTRVTKVVKGGKLMGFRCVAVCGNQAGLVGVGCAAGREVATAVKRALVDAKKSVVMVSLVGSGTLPHRMEAKFHSARMVVLPASDGTGVIAGGAIRSVLELAGVKDCLAKRIGCRSPLNNARATIKALTQMRSLYEVSARRGVPMSQLLLPKRIKA